MPCSTEGALMRRHVGGARCGACGLGFAIPAPGRLGSPSALLRGLPSVAGRDRMKGGESRPDNVRDTPPVRPRKHGPEVKNRHKWSAGRCACRSHGARHREVPDYDVAPFGALLPHMCEGQGKRRRRPRARTKGADGARLGFGLSFLPAGGCISGNRTCRFHDFLRWVSPRR